MKVKIKVEFFNDEDEKIGPMLGTSFPYTERLDNEYLLLLRKALDELYTHELSKVEKYNSLFCSDKE